MTNGANGNQKIPWGRDGEIEFKMPRGWRLLGRMMPAEAAPLEDVQRELERVLDNPAGSKSLEELARGKLNIVIVVDDISRPTPAHLLLGKVLERLEQAGADLGTITIVPGLGVHRPMTQEEMERKAGKEDLARVKWENPDCHDTKKLTYLGKTKRGTRAFVNKTVAGADLVIMIGTIEPHPHAGFGGGFKNILPGVAGAETISANHAICAHPKYYSMLGTPPDANPMRLDIEEVGRMLRGDTFLLNTVLNSGGGIVKLVAGDPVAAHREGVATAERLFGADIPARADVVITDSHPMDLDLRQGVKAVANVLFAAKPGGVILVAMRCEEGMPGVRVPKVKLPLSHEATKFLARILCALLEQFAPPGISPEERFAAYFMCRALLRNRLVVYAPEIANRVSGVLPSVPVFGDFQAALAAARKLKPDADVLIFPNGGVTYPIRK